jgi:hypothetical protein
VISLVGCPSSNNNADFLLLACTTLRTFPTPLLTFLSILLQQLCCNPFCHRTFQAGTTSINRGNNPQQYHDSSS